MCTEEFIAYQCGHRSMSVVRPCPMTTAGHNFPVCSGPPHKPHFAETMCSACERQLHSRWVLIREWEHRWMHERGVCGCKVVFPGLLTTPRVTGEASGSAENLDMSALAEIKDKEEEEQGASSDVVVSDETEKIDLQTKDVQTDTSKDDNTTALIANDKDSQVPAIFTEGVTSSGEHHVVVRLPGLYAAEWHADHAALHEEGKCSCNTDFRPFTPGESEEDMSPQDKETLREWRETDAAADSKSPRATDRQGEGKLNTMEKRIVEIKEEFGEFEVEGEIPEQEQAHQLPALTLYYPSTIHLPASPAQQINPQAIPAGTRPSGQIDGGNDLTSSPAAGPLTRVGHHAEPAASETPAHKSENHKLDSSASAAAIPASTLIQRSATTEAQIPAHETVNRRLNSSSNKNSRKSTLPAPHPSLPPRPKTPIRGPHHNQLAIPSQLFSPPSYRYQPTQPHLYPPTPSTSRVPAQRGYNNHYNNHRRYQQGGFEYTPSHRSQQFFGPANPAYATPTTYSDGIPFGAYPWAAQPQQTPGKPCVAQGPGPYRTSGLVYPHGGSNNYSPAHGHNYNGNGGQTYYNYNTPGNERPFPSLEYTGTGTGQSPAGGYQGQQRRMYTNSNTSPSPNPLGSNDNNNFTQQQHRGRRGNRGNRGFSNRRVSDSQSESKSGSGLSSSSTSQGNSHHTSDDRGSDHVSESNNNLPEDNNSHTDDHADHDNHDAHRQQEQQEKPSVTPLCGLPIGAGPEGTSHMPSWTDCPLRRRSASASAGLLMISEGFDDDDESTNESDDESVTESGDGDGDGGEVEGGEVEGEVEIAELEAGVDGIDGQIKLGLWGEGWDEGEEDEEEEMMPRLRRRHSASA